MADASGGPDPALLARGIHSAEWIGRLDLKGIGRAAATCPRCELRESRTFAVSGEGPAPARVMFVGEAPGAREDRTGRPLVGNAGRLFDRLLAVAGLRREEVYITNAVKCRPPGNRTPRSVEVEACNPYLRRQIELVDPLVICPLGAAAVRAVLGRAQPVGELRGRPFRHGGRTVLVTYHPASSFYRRELQPELEADMRLLADLLAAAPTASREGSRGEASAAGSAAITSDPSPH